MKIFLKNVIYSETEEWNYCEGALDDLIIMKLG